MSATSLHERIPFSLPLLPSREVRIIYCRIDFVIERFEDYKGSTPAVKQVYKTRTEHVGYTWH